MVWACFLVTNKASDALWPRNARYVVSLAAVVAPHPPSNNSIRTLAHLPCHVTDELALAALTLLHIPRGGRPTSNSGNLAMCTARCTA